MKLAVSRRLNATSEDDSDSSTPGETDAENSGGPGAACPEWLARYWDVKRCRWMISRQLVMDALTQDESLAGVLALNELSGNIEARRDWPWMHGRAGPIKGSTDLMLGLYLSDTYGLPSIPRAALTEAIDSIAQSSLFHPIRDYLVQLEWDNQPRLDQWLSRVLYDDRDRISPALSEYVGLVGRFLILGMVYRVMQPGCKFDYCPVFEGPGGLGKSTLVKTLAGKSYFSDAYFNLARGKEGQEQVQGLWLYEISELSSFSKAEIALIKAFISAQVDRYRPSYGRVVESYPRQCIMVGTTNETSYLRDRTGNRRFWPVPVTRRIHLNWLESQRDQLFAEAFVRFQRGERYTPTPEEELRLFYPMQESRLVETAVMSEMHDLLTRTPHLSGIGAEVHGMANFVTLAQLTQALGVTAAKSSAPLEKQIRDWLQFEGWVRIRKQVAGARVWGYERPQGWPSGRDFQRDQGFDTGEQR